MSFGQSFQNILGWEGGACNNVKDPGGATCFGVTQSEYNSYRAKKGRPEQPVAKITLAEAEELYRASYWDATSCDRFNQGLANTVFDSDVNSGDRRGAQWLQQAINQVDGHALVTVDGVVGDKTVAAANSLPPDKLIDAMLNLRLAFMHVAKHPETGALLWTTFGRGWQSRIDGVRVQSHKLAGTEVPQTPLISVPQALLSEPKKETPVMSTTATTPAAAVPAPAANSDAFQALLNAAKTDITAIKQKITGAFAGLASGGASIALAAMLGDKTMALIVGTVGGFAGLLTIYIHIYSLFTGLGANNSSTVLLAESAVNAVQSFIGVTPTVWDNGPAAPPASA